ncbi:hypothetical protein RKD23_000467 [Streptomyces sp. SAI-170]|uniref:hypothetical protein n=1 Tax=Streptomyces sp. SAI-170 TaxID=3377729 RepID=UPI003C7B8C8E
MPGSAEAWQVAACSRIAALKDLAAAIEGEPAAVEDARELLSRAKMHLAEAEGVTEGRRRPVRVGASAETSAHTDAAEMLLLQAAAYEQFSAYLPEITHRVRTQLPPADPRRERFNETLRRNRQDKGPVDREAAMAALRAAREQHLSGWARVRALHRSLLVTLVVMTVSACVLAALGALRPEVLSLCFESANRTTCPIGDTPRPGDVAFVELVGLVGGALGVGAALRRYRATSAVSMLPFTCAVLKLPTGALCAFLGLTLMTGDFLPGLGGLDNQSQILAWALIFGFAQELLTRQVDNRVHQVLQEATEPPVSLPDIDQWDDLLDQRLSEVEANVTATVGDLMQDRIRRNLRGSAGMAFAGAIATAVGVSVQRSLRGPEIIAFSGFVKVTLHHPDGTSVEADPAGPTLAPDSDYTLRVRVSTEEPAEDAAPVTPSEAMAIAGKTGEAARFALVPEIEGVTARPSRREVGVQTSQGTAVCDFELHTPARQGECPGWVAIYQHTRLVHIVRFRLLVGAEA